MTTLASLPPELLCMIIGYLRDDPNAILNLAQTNKRYLEICRELYGVLFGCECAVCAKPIKDPKPLMTITITCSGHNAPIRIHYRCWQTWQTANISQLTLDLQCFVPYCDGHINALSSSTVFTPSRLHLQDTLHRARNRAYRLSLHKIMGNVNRLWLY